MKKKKKCEDSMPHTGGKYSTLTRDESKPQNKGKDQAFDCTNAIMLVMPT